MSDLTEKITSVLDLIPTELQGTPNTLIDLLTKASWRIDELEKTLEQQRWANEMLNASNIDIRKKCAELEIKLSQVLAVISGRYDDTYCPHGAEWGTCERCPRGEIE